MGSWRCAFCNEKRKRSTRHFWLHSKQSLVSNAVHTLEALWCVLVDVRWVYGIVWTNERSVDRMKTDEGSVDRVWTDGGSWSKHIKGSKECCFLGQNTTCKFSSYLSSYKTTLKQQLDGEKQWKMRWQTQPLICFVLSYVVFASSEEGVLT